MLWDSKVRKINRNLHQSLCLQVEVRFLLERSLLQTSTFICNATFGKSSNEFLKVKGNLETSEWNLGCGSPQNEAVKCSTATSIEKRWWKTWVCFFFGGQSLPVILNGKSEKTVLKNPQVQVWFVRGLKCWTNYDSLVCRWVGGKMSSLQQETLLRLNA